jgi:glycosyltransferase involved in cell wall biosynthesis
LQQGKINSLCVFGSFEDSELYSRNRVLIETLSNCVDKVSLVRPHVSGRSLNNHQRVASVGALLSSVWEQVRHACSLFRQRAMLRGADCYFVPYPAYVDLFLLRLFTPGNGRPPVIIDAFLCLHDTVVGDREMVTADGFAARLVRKLEQQTLINADLVLIDTEQQRQLLIHQYGLKPAAVHVVPVGIDEDVWRPLPPAAPGEATRVLFWGTFIPLHGVEVIVAAAHILERKCPWFEFMLVGEGQTATQIQDLIEQLGLKSISWHRGLLSGAELQKLVGQSHCVLGIFGESVKAGNVVPYKACQAMASNRVLITRGGPAMDYLYEEGQGLIRVPAGDPEALADALMTVHEQHTEQVGQVNTRAIYDRCLGRAAIEKSLQQALKEL